MFSDHHQPVQVWNKPARQHHSSVSSLHCPKYHIILNKLQKKPEDNIFAFYFYFPGTQLRIRNFSFSTHNDNKNKSTEGGISQLLEESEGAWTESRPLEPNDDRWADHRGEISDYRSSTTISSMKSGLKTAQYISKDKTELWYSVSPSVARTSSCNILWQDSLYSPKWIYHCILSTFMMFAHQNGSYVGKCWEQGTFW